MFDNVMPDYSVARVFMMISLTISFITIITMGFAYLKVKNGARRRYIASQSHRIVWLGHVFLFYLYGILIAPHWDIIPNVWFLAWGSIIVLHGVINVFAITFIRLITWESSEKYNARLHELK